ncbi:hypothetical protein IWX90DRAFT_295341 [Phyllosticta citrichinensis]|uniref:Uncharacterized protein n=1 Tax=Phyllosticta citrichinensis TaxID=1130410 RepID=A0ABR1XKB7_9PEZI
MIPDIPLGVSTGIMAPAIKNDEVLDAKGDQKVIAFAGNSDKWIHTILKSDGWNESFRLKEFGTRAYPLQPDRRHAFFHLLINMFYVRRWEQNFRVGGRWWAEWHDHVGEMMKGERWGVAASSLRRSNVLQMAATIGHIKDFGAEFKGGIEETNNQDADPELDMLITNIIEEHLFPSPAVIFPEDESKFERLVFGETDIVAQMQRRKAHSCGAEAPGATVRCVYAANKTVYWDNRGSELTVYR